MEENAGTALAQPGNAALICDGSRWRARWHGRILNGYAASLRITLAMTLVMVACGLMQQVAATIPLLLGVIASALAETDDNWRARLGAQVTTLGCFALVIMAVNSSLAQPALLMAVFVAAAFLLTLLGALGERYRTMAAATLIMSLYAALAAQSNASHALAGQQEILLLSGAAWHGVISVVWAAAFPMLPVEQQLAQLYAALGEYLKLKARLFEPVRGIDLDERRLALALHNGRVVDALNASKEGLLARRHGRLVPLWLGAALHQFFVAQDVHERTSSSHEHYELLADTFFHSDVLYRCQRLLALLGGDCLTLAQAIRSQQSWARGDASARALADLDAAISHVERSSPAPDGDLERRARRALRLLASNLGAIDQELAGVLQNERRRMPADTALQDLQARSWGQFGARLRAQLSLTAPLMRHAIRLSAALLAGYALMWTSGDRYGFWILLTIVFVCQPHYGATLTRLTERIGGTVLGLLIGWALLRLFPAPLEQAALVVAAAVFFFTLRTTRYLLATAGITIFVLLSLNQVGDGYGLIVPRLLDTLAGSAIAGLAVWRVLPCWNSLRLPQLAAATLRAQARYFDEIMAQYGVAGRHDNLAYRIARRDAHNADAALAAALTAAFKEPRRVRRPVEAGTRFLLLSHTLLNYLSALGAHRDAQLARDDDAMAAAALLHHALEKLAQALAAGASGEATEATEATDKADAAHETTALRALARPPADEAEFHRVVRAQLTLALSLLPHLRAATGALLRK